MRRAGAKKGLGQHFLVDSPAIHRIVEAAHIEPDDLVVEIGPGRGALTGPLLKRASRVVGIEIDRSLCALLQEAWGQQGNLTLLNGDVLGVDLPALIRAEGFKRAVLVGNLPYHITGGAVRQILGARTVLKRAVFTVQREVAQRMVAPPGGKPYGILSVAVQIQTRPERLFDLSPGHFVPPPKVHSSVVRLDFTSTAPVRVQDEQLFFHVVRTVFRQRRKMVKNTMMGLVGGCKEQLMQAFSAGGIDPRLRPEAISPGQFEQFCRVLAAVRRTKSDRNAGQKGRQSGAPSLNSGPKD